MQDRESSPVNDQRSTTEPHDIPNDVKRKFLAAWTECRWLVAAAGASVDWAERSTEAASALPV